MLVLLGAALTAALAPSLVDAVSGQNMQAGGTPHSGMSAPNGPSHDALADLLDNAAGRNALIQQLRELAKSAPAAAPPTTSTAPARVDGAISGLPAESGDTTTFSRRIAATTQAFLEGVVEDFRDALAALQSLKPGHSGHGALVDQWIFALISLAIVISATLLAYALFRLLASSIYRRIDRWVAIQAAARRPL